MLGCSSLVFRFRDETALPFVFAIEAPSWVGDSEETSWICAIVDIAVDSGHSVKLGNHITFNESRRDELLFLMTG